MSMCGRSPKHQLQLMDNDWLRVVGRHILAPVIRENSALAEKSALFAGEECVALISLFCLDYIRQQP